jgi:hypothetical protein
MTHPYAPHLIHQSILLRLTFHTAILHPTLLYLLTHILFRRPNLAVHLGIHLPTTHPLSLSIHHLGSLPYLVMWVLPQPHIRPGNLRLQDRRLVWPGDTPSFCDKLVLRCGVVDACQGIPVGGEFGSCFGCSTSEEVTSDEGKVGEEFADFRVCEDEGEECA